MQAQQTAASGRSHAEEASGWNLQTAIEDQIRQIGRRVTAAAEDMAQRF